MQPTLRLAAGVLLLVSASVGEPEAVPEKKASKDDKLLGEMVELDGGWFSFGTSFADADEPEEFAPENEEKERFDGLKDSVGSEAFGAIAQATGMDKAPDTLHRDGAFKAKQMKLRPFKIEKTAVTNAQYKRFVRDTKYKTEAEKFQWSFVLELLASNATLNATDAEGGLGRVRDSPWWLGVEGAYWRKPEGPDSTVQGRMDHPAVHISWNDADAYCKWAGRRLPTETEWEYAARGGLEDEPFPWGDAHHDSSERLNCWEGEFPDQNAAVPDGGGDGYAGTAPAAAYSPNAYGVYNMVGNVWEWCSGGSDEKRPLRGGSYVDTLDGRYNHAIRSATRMDQTADSGSANTGFRCATRWVRPAKPDPRAAEL